MSKMKKNKTSLKSSTDIYLPDDCWEHVFTFLNDGDNNHRYLEPLSIVSKQFLSITNRLRFSLSIRCNPPRPYLRKLFQRFPNLTSLDLTRFHGNLNSLLCTIGRFPIDISNIKSLKLTHQSTIPSNGLRVLSKKITTLTSFTCSNIASISNEELFLISDCFSFLEEFDLGNSFSKKISKIKNKKNSFSKIISSVGIDNMSMTLCKLRKVNLSAYYIDDESLLNLCKNCEFLEELIMFECPFLTYHGVASAIRERPTLKSLSFGWRLNDDISSYFIDSLVSLKGLTCLEFSSFRISDELLSCIAMKGLPLRRLVLKNCRDYTFDGIFSLLSQCQCIQHLELRDTTFLNDQHVVELSSFFGDLVSINLSHCYMLTDSTLFALVRNCPSLREIKMEYTSIGKMSVEDSNSILVNLVVSPQLKSLRLANNTRLRDEKIIMFASICPNLQFLDLSDCSEISEGIGEVLRCCKIRYMNLACCLGLKLLGMNFKVSTLEVLNLSETGIDDRSLYVISKSFFGLLQLDLGRCYHVTEKGVREVVEKCMMLREINLECCGKVKANVVDFMVFIRPSLRKITAPPSFRRCENKRKLFLRHGCLVC